MQQKNHPCEFVQSNSVESPDDVFCRTQVSGEGMERDYKELYRDVPSDKKDPYFKFRDTQPYQMIVSGGYSWKYLSCKNGGDTLLLLPGGTGEGAGFFRVIENLNKHFSVIAPSYPLVNTINELLDGILAVMDAEHVRAAHVLGASAGGHIAQCLAKRNPDRVKKLILTNTFVPEPEYESKIRKSPILLRILPRWLITRVGLRKWRKIAQKTVPSDEFTFLEAYVREIYKYTNIIEQIESYGRLYHSLLEKFSFKPGDLCEFEILIIEGALDDAVGAKRRETLKRTYPHAKVLTFNESGHEIVFLKAEEYADAVTNFILQ